LRKQVHSDVLLKDSFFIAMPVPSERAALPERFTTFSYQSDCNSSTT